MRRIVRRIPLLVLVALALAAGPAGAGPNLVVGAAENAVLSADAATAASRFSLATAVGFDAVRIALPWQPGQTAPDGPTLSALTTTSQQAAVGGIRLYLEVYPASAAGVPRDDASRQQFAGYLRALALALPQVRDVVVGSQVNNPAFWPQGAKAAGEYVALLAASYDALEGVDPAIQVIGGALSSQEAPGTYVLAMGKAYRSSGRGAPIMDALAIQPSNASSADPPTLVHAKGPIGIADYPRLVANLKRAFAGTAQPGAALPIVYDGYAVQTRVPPDKASLYGGAESDAVDEATQGASYAKAVELAACQSNVAALLFGHLIDETDLAGSQTGLYYPDLTPKSDLRAVADAVTALRAGTGACARSGGSGPAPTVTLDPAGAGATIACSSDCYYVAVLVRVAGEVPLRARQGAVAAGASTLVALSQQGLPAGEYRLVVQAAAKRTPSAATRVEGDAVTVG